MKKVTERYGADRKKWPARYRGGRGKKKELVGRVQVAQWMMGFTPKNTVALNNGGTVIKRHGDSLYTVKKRGD
jgi:hypothetical protein